MKSVLIVDDSRVMRQLVRRSLRQAGYKPRDVHEAEDGAEALAMLEGGLRPSLVLSDWNMPTMNGIELLRAMNAKRLGVKLGFITSESTPEMRGLAMGAGAVFLLTKPFKAADVRLAIEQAGFRPEGKLRDTGRAINGQAAFGSELITTLLDHLVNQRITTRPGTPFPPTLAPAITCTWVDDDDALLYAGVCEMGLAAALGAAVGMRPASAAADVVSDGAIPPELQADCREVFNVLSRAFTDAGSVHVRLHQIAFAPAPMLAAVSELNTRAAGRHDFKISVGSHGAGRLGFLSTSPGFIHYAAGAGAR